MKKRNVIIILLLLILSLSGVVGWFLLKGSNVSAQKLYELALENKAKVLEAKKLLNEAEKKSVADPELVWAIANYEAETGNSSQAQSYALKAWKLGKQDKECFLALLHNSGLPTVELQVEYGRKLLNELQSDVLKKELEADMHFGLKEYDLALELFKSLYKENPDKRMAVKIAYVLSIIGKSLEAIEFLENSDTALGMDAQGYSLLATLNFLSNKIEALKDLFKRADSVGIKNEEYLYKQALILTMLNEFGDAIKVLNKIFKISETSLLSQARILYSYNLKNIEDEDKITELLESIRDIDSAVGEGERLFYEMLIALESNEIPLEQINENLKKASRLLGTNFIVGLVNARLSSDLGKFDQALDFYQTYNEPLAKNWGRLTTDKAYALMGSGDDIEAIKMLESYHINNGQFSLESLLLLRDLYLEQSKFKQALKVHSILERLLPAELSLKIFRASIYMLSGSVDKAVNSLESLYENVGDEKKSEVKHALVKMYLSVGSYTKVLEETQGIQSLELIRAQALTALGQLDEAKTIYKKAYQSNKSSDISKKYVFFLLSIGSQDQALKVIEEGKAEEGNTGWIALAHASMNLANGELAEATKNLKIANLDEQLALHCLYLESEILFQRGELLGAHKDLNELIVKTPNDYRVYQLKAQCFMRESNFKDAQKSIENALRIRPDNASLNLTLAEILFVKRSFEEALKLSLKLQSNDSLKIPSLMIEIKSLISMNKLNAALNSLEKLKPLDLEAYHLLKADIFLSKNEPKAAIQVLEGLADNVEASYRIVKIKAGLNQEISNLKNYAFEYQQYLQLAEIFISHKNYRKAAICYKSALSINSDNSLLLNNFAWCLYKSGDSLNAEAKALKAYSLTPRNNEIIHTLARVLIKNKKYKDCENLLSPVISRAVSVVRFHYSLGEVYENLGNKQEALYHYKFALSKSSKDNWRLPVGENELSLKIKSILP